MSAMRERPHVLDNEDPETQHGEALRFLVDDLPDRALSVATGYVDLSGLAQLAELAKDRPVRLLIGAEPQPGLGAQSLIAVFDQHRERLAHERNLARFPPSRAIRQLRAVEEWLKRPDAQVRRYVKRFLHGKAYVLGDAADARAALITSANLTGAGLAHNLELGVVDYGTVVPRSAVEWFDRLWNEAVDYADALRDLLFPDPGLVDPETVYLRALLELHEPELDDAARPTSPTGLTLTDFQRDGYERARAIAARHGGVIYADGVGTGKTEIGLAFIEERTKEEGVYALVVAPAQLTRRWQERILQAKLPAQVVSFNALARDEQLAPGIPDARRELANTKDAYRLVVVDEAHALRNEDTTWYRAMERLLGGSRKQVLLLSATPINNGLWDLYNLVMLFARHDRAFASIGIDSIRQLFIDAGANERDPDQLEPERLFPLAEAVSVRRDRAFIEREYSGSTFPDGTPVRFPRPRLATRRYDIDSAHPGLLAHVVAAIDGLTMARYRPSAYVLGEQESAAETQLSGLLRSGILKRFESCWYACLKTIESMLAAHDAFLAAWEAGKVLPPETLREASRLRTEDDAALAAWLEQQIIGPTDARPVEDFDSRFVEDVRADRALLDSARSALQAVRAEHDPKLALLIDLLEGSPDKKIVVFSAYADTVRYLDKHLPQRLGGRERVVVIGNETSPDERIAALSRFAPKTIVRDDYEPPDGEVDLLIATDVLSEGQNLQQAQAVISYDMPWNPQRVVQRYGRVIRLRSAFDEVHLTTMLPAEGELEELLRLEVRIEAKIRAAGVFGMEVDVIETEREAELKAFAARIEAGDPTLLDEPEQASGAFVGEELRRRIERAAAEGELARVLALPWGVGSCFRQTASGRSRGPAGIFFALRTKPMEDAPEGYRYWRFLETDTLNLLDNDLEILRRIDPEGGEPSDLPESLDLDAAWQAAAADIVAAHNKRADLRAQPEQIGPLQRWALSVLRDPSVSLPPNAQLAHDALSVERSSAVRRALGEIQTALNNREISRDMAAERIVEVVESFGLQRVEPPPLPREITEDDLGVVCWMAVLPSRSA